MNPALTLQFERAVNEYAQWQAVPAEDRSDAPAWWWDTALVVRYPRGSRWVDLR